MLKVGVLSDTHGGLPEAALERLRGCDRLIHAGDVGDGGVLELLEALGAPLTVVAGNIDPAASGLPLEVRLELAGASVLVRHIQPPPDRLPAYRLRELQESGVDVLVFGHSHKPLAEERGGVLFANPGSAGQPRYGLPASVGYLWLGDGPPRFELVPLPPRS